MNMTLLELIIVGVIIAFGIYLLAKESYTIPKWQQVYIYLLDQEHQKRLNNISKIVDDLMLYFDLTYDQATICILCYKQGDEWFRNCKFLKDK